jgi:hypothetical protein
MSSGTYSAEPGKSLTRRLLRVEYKLHKAGHLYYNDFRTPSMRIVESALSAVASAIPRTNGYDPYSLKTIDRMLARSDGPDKTALSYALDTYSGIQSALQLVGNSIGSLKEQRVTCVRLLASPRIRPSSAFFDVGKGSGTHASVAILRLRSSVEHLGHAPQGPGAASMCHPHTCLLKPLVAARWSAYC